MTLRRARLGTRPRERVLPWVLAAVALAGVGLVVGLRRPTAPPLPPVATDLDTFAPEVLAAVEAYRTPRYLLAPVATLLAVAVPLWFVLHARGRTLVGRWAGGRDHSAWRAGLVATGIAAVTSLVTFPLAAWNRIVEDGRWGFRTQPALGWVRDWLLVSSGRWLLTGCLVALLFAAMRRWPRTWPARLTVVGTAIVVLFVALHPLVVQPLLLPTSPLPDGELRTAIEELVAEAGDPQVPIVVGEASLRTTRVNAAVVGLGPTEQVVLHDTLLGLPEDQVLAVVAHELAHHEHGDLLRGVLLSSAALLVGLVVVQGVLRSTTVRRRFGSRGPTDPRLAAVVLATAVLLELVGTPVGNAVSRRVELAADARALSLTGDAEPLVRTTRTFTVRDLAAPDPPRLVHRYYGSHPTVGQRLRYAAAWAEANGVPLPTRDDLAEDEAEVAHPAVREGPP